MSLLKKESLLPHDVNNQDFTDRESRTDSGLGDFYLHDVAQGGSQGTGGGLNRPRDLLSLTHPRAQRGKRPATQDVSPSRWEVTCGE